MAGFQVVAGRQVAYGGRVYGPGKTIDRAVPAALVAEWLRVGWVEPVDRKRRT